MCRWLAYSGSPLLLDPPAAIERAVGLVEEVAGRHGIVPPEGAMSRRAAIASNHHFSSISSSRSSVSTSSSTLS